MNFGECNSFYFLSIFSVKGAGVLYGVMCGGKLETEYHPPAPDYLLTRGLLILRKLLQFQKPSLKIQKYYSKITN